MKKILYIGNKLNKANTNVSYISVLGSLLSKEDHEVFYASSRNNKILRLFDMMYKVMRLSRKVDKVLIDTYSTQNYYYALIVSQICRLLNLEYIPILHGGNLPERLKSNPKMSRMIFKHSKCNVSPSIYLKNSFEQFGYNNIIHIPNTVNIKKYPFSNKVFDSPRLLWVRSFSKIYNPKLAIKTLHLLKKTHPTAEMCMVGPDSDGTLNDVKKLAQELNLEVTFTGKLTKIEWVELSQNYNVFLNTTNFDNMPLSVIEAMALGLPVVSTNVGGLPFLIQNNRDGYLVEPDNVVEMVNAIERVFNASEKRTSILIHAREKVEQLDWENVKKLWFQILN